MPILDEFTTLEQRVRARLTELRPLAEEYHELEQLAQRLGINGKTSTKRAGAAARKASATPSKKAPARGTRRRGRPAAAKKAAAGSAVTPRRGRPAAAKKPAAGTATTATAPTAAPADSTTKKQATASRRSRSTKATGLTRRAAGRGRKGTRSEQLAALVKQRPGITVKQAADDMGVDATSLYRVVRQLEQSGKVSKKGRELQPA